MTTGIDRLAGKLAANALGKFGTAMVLRTKRVGTYDPVTDTDASGTRQHRTKGTINTALKVFLQGVAPGEGAMVRVSRFEVIIPRIGLPWTPDIGDKVEIVSANKTFTVTEATPQYSGDDVAFYTLRLDPI